MKHLGFLPEKAGSSEKGDRNIQNYINKNKHIIAVPLKSKIVL